MKTTAVSKALILDTNGHMLLLRRSHTHPTLALRPDLPGGLIDNGEEPGEALIREILEETKLEVTFAQLRIAYTATHVYDNQNMVKSLYIVQLDSEAPEVVISWEHDGAEWVSVSRLGELETEFHSFYQDALHHIRMHKLLEA